MSPDFETRLRQDYGALLPQSVALTEIKDGWYSLLNHTLAVLFVRSEIGGGPPVTIHKVSQQMGSLRLEYNGGDDHIHGAVDLATSLSVHLCEICGDQVHPRRMHFHWPRCIVHYDGEDKVEVFINELSEPHPPFEIPALETKPRTTRRLKPGRGS